jgi:hypothetical protein
MSCRELAAALLIAFGPSSVCAADEPRVNPEQMALDYVASNWGPKLYDHDCAGWSLGSDAPLLVFTRSSGFTITLVDVADLAGIDLKEVLAKEGSLQDLQRRGVTEDAKISVAIPRYPTMERASTAKLGGFDEPLRGHLLRFSNRLRYNDRTFLQVWIKDTMHASGVRISYEFDANGKMQTSVRSLCDDRG